MVRAGHKRKSAAVDYKAYQSEQQVARYATPMTRPTRPKHSDKQHRYRSHGGDRVTSNVFYCHGLLIEIRCCTASMISPSAFATSSRSSVVPRYSRYSRRI